METYFIISASEDGVSMKAVNKEELLEAITPNEYGETDYGVDVVFLDEMPSGYDWFNYQRNSLLIIKGEVVVPKPKKVVTEYDI